MKPFKIVSTGFKPDRFWLDSSGVNLLQSTTTTTTTRVRSPTQHTRSFVCSRTHDETSS